MVSTSQVNTGSLLSQPANLPVDRSVRKQQIEQEILQEMAAMIKISRRIEALKAQLVSL